MTISKKNWKRGIRLKPDNVAFDGKEGELKVELSSAKFQAYLGGASRNIVTEDQVQTLTNKSIDGTTNTLTNIGNASVAPGLDAAKIANGSVSNTEFQYLDGATSNIQSQINADVAALAAHIANPTDAHDATAISFASTPAIPSTDVQSAIQGVQSNLEAHIADTSAAHAASAVSAVPHNTILGTDVQTQLQQIDARITSAGTGNVQGPASSVDNTLPRFDGTTGKLIQGSGIVVSDTNQVTGVNSISASGTIVTTGNLNANGTFSEGQAENSTITGTAAELPITSAGLVRLTNAGLTSLSSIIPAVGAQVLTIENASGNSITINNESGGTSSDYRILTGTKAALTLADQASLILKYDSFRLRWMVIGGTGAGAGAPLSVLFQLTGTDVAQWSTGNNATVLGGGTLSGTFVADSSTPLQGIASYRYTQAGGSLNDYILSPAQAVDRRFRGTTTTLFFPFTYDGAASDIQVIFYDVTNATVIPSSTFIPVSTTNGIFRTNITIPSTCASIRVGFQVKALNSGKIFAFDSVELSADTTVSAPLSNDLPMTSFAPTGSWTSNTTYTGQWRRNGEYMEGWVQVSLTGAPNATTLSVNLPSGYAMDLNKLASNLIRQTVGDVYFLDAGVQAYLGTISPVTSTSFNVNYTSSTGSVAPVAIAGTASNTLPFAFNTGDLVNINFSVPILGWTATNTNILTAPDTFSTETASLAYASSSAYTIATLANAPVGTFITYSGAINSVARVQSTTAPTQTISDMSQNGILIYPKAYNAASSANQPSSIAIQIGKGLKGVSLGLYKASGKTTSGEVDFVVLSTTSQSGLYNKSYNELTGVLLIDVQNVASTAVTSNLFQFSDQTVQTSGYLTINASKNPALTGLNISAVAARGVNTAGTLYNATRATVVYDNTKTYDTNASLNNATGIFTAPDSGYYGVSAHLAFASSSYTSGQFIEITLWKNGALYSFLGSVIAQTSITTSFEVTGSDQVSLNRGDTCYIQVRNSRGSTALDTTSGINYFSITKNSVG